MALKVKEVSRLTGISVRTLHHYDEIGLLRPDAVTEAGYRMYSDHDMERLQQILFFRKLGFSLKEIRRILGRVRKLRWEQILLIFRSQQGTFLKACRGTSRESDAAESEKAAKDARRLSLRTRPR